MKKLKQIPTFDSEAEEQRFWLKHDTTDYMDWSKAKTARFPTLKTSTKAISIRLPETLLYDIKILANREDVPYQSMLKILLNECVKAHRKHD